MAFFKRKRRLLWLLVPLALLVPIAIPFIRNPIGNFRLTVKHALELWHIEEKQVKVDNLRIRYFEGGANHPQAVILLHGFGGNALFTWFQLLPALQKKYHVYAPDLLASNFLRLNPSQYSVNQEVQLLLQFMDTLGIQQADFVGLSVGGWVSLILALEHPERVRSLILVESAGLKTEIPEIARLTLDNREKAKRFMELLFYHQPPLPDFVLDQLVRSSKVVKKRYEAIFAGFVKNSEASLVDDRLAEIHHPTLIIHGREDRVMPLDVALRLNQGIADSKLVILEHSGHAPVWDSPFQLKREILTFLSQAPAPISPSPSPAPLAPVQ